MARKTIEITIASEGRDQGKTFSITEMSAVQAEKWAWRAFMGLDAVGIDVPERSGIAGLALIGLRALTKMRWDTAEPLLDELMSCVKIRSPNPRAGFRDLVENDIEEIRTRLELRDAVFALHTGFSPAGVLSRLISAALAESSSNIQTSHGSSQTSSPPDSPSSMN